MSGLDLMKKRVLWKGEDILDRRNVTGKLKSFHSALLNSYQAEWITLDNEEEIEGKEKKRYRCLINPDKIKNDYDQKEISIDFDAGMKNGDTFYWTRTGHHWIAYQQRYEEEAYFRAQIRRCDYQIEVNGHPYWIYLRGPVETALVWRQKHQIEFNDMNLSILFYITRNEETNEFLERLKILKFDNHKWRIEATDRYSQDGLIEVYMQEYFDNDMEDEQIIPAPIEPDKELPYIDGPQFVKPYDTNVTYSLINESDGEFVVNYSKVKINKIDDTSCSLDINTGKSNSFILQYMKDGVEVAALTINIKSL